MPPPPLPRPESAAAGDLAARLHPSRQDLATATAAVLEIRRRAGVPPHDGLSDSIEEDFHVEILRPSVVTPTPPTTVVPTNEVCGLCDPIEEDNVQLLKPHLPTATPRATTVR